MYEKVNPSHPDKVADRIAGAIVDLAYTKQNDPKVAVEVLIGHGHCTIITECSEHISRHEVRMIINRIVGAHIRMNYYPHEQDYLLADNQSKEVRCGDNGIFKGCPVTDEQERLSCIARDIYNNYETDGKYILNGSHLIICQSFAAKNELRKYYPDAIINPLGYWTGGIDVDAGATNRKLGSDMGDGVTGGGLHGKDLSKADVSVNIYCHGLAQQTGRVVTASCAIGDTEVEVVVTGQTSRRVPYAEIVEEARNYIKACGGFEKFAEWGLV